MKVYVTKYALTAGIKEMEGRLLEGYFKPDKGYSGLITKNHFFEKREDAVAAADKMRQKKIASLESQIKKLKQKSF